MLKMRSIAVLSVTIQILVLLSYGFNHVQAQTSPLALQITRDETLEVEYASRLAKRAGGTLLPLGFDNQNALFFTNISVGTPPQPMRVAIETNNADTYVMSNASQICQSGQCAAYGIYQSSQSSTYTFLNANFSESFADKTSILGDYVTETVAFGGTTVRGLTMAVVSNTTNVPFGALGIGYFNLESSTTKYPNLPVLMYNNQQINSVAYSMWLNPINPLQGQLVIGGVDTGKFLGKLESFPVYFDNLQYNYVTIDLASFGIANGSTLTTSPLPVTIDAGSTLMYLPRNITTPLFTQLGLTYDSNTYGVAPCSSFRNSTTLQFVFGSTVIAIPVGNITSRYNNTHCYLQIATQTDGVLITLGLAFMRSAYVVFDFSRNQVSLAPSNSNTTNNNITAISSDGVTGLASTAIGRTNNGSNSTNGITGPGGTNSTDSPPSGGLSKGAKIGIGVGVSLGVIVCALLVGLYFLFFRRRKAAADKEKSTHPEVPATSNPTTQSYMDKSELAGSEATKRHQSELPRRSELDSPTHERNPSNLTALHSSNNKYLSGPLTDQPQELPADVPRHEMHSPDLSRSGFDSSETAAISGGGSSTANEGSKSRIPKRKPVGSP